MTSEDLWWTDRSRFVRGWECAWKRFLEYHAFSTGIRANFVDAALSTGSYIHRVLERLMRRVKAGEEHKDWMSPTNQDLLTVLAAYKEEVERSRGFTTEETLDHQLDLVVGMAHGYARSVLPWVAKNFEIMAIEQEFNYRLPGSNIVWMVRPDLLLYSKLTNVGGGSFSSHDFKSTSYWTETESTRQWVNSIQMMANSFVASKATGDPYETYYIHNMVKGNKKYPNLLTHAYYKPGNPPFQKEEWVANYTRAKAFSKVRVADYRSLPEWIWEVDGQALATKFPVVGPYTVQPYTVGQFFSGVITHENWWKGIVKDLHNIDWKTDWEKPSFQQHLDRHIPRTFNCFDFGGRKCQFYDICHKTDTATWSAPLDNGYTRRIPNHPQEGKDDGPDQQSGA